jgi:hypothetical protein
MKTLRCGRLHVVSAVFMEDEARRICNMVISPSSHRDRLVWMGNKNGVYTVRSGYHFAMEGAVRNEGSTSTHPTCPTLEVYMEF